MYKASEPNLIYIPTGFADNWPFQVEDVTGAKVMSTDEFRPGPLVYEEWECQAVEAIRAWPLPS